MTFESACSECLDNKGLLNEFNRLTGNHLGESRTNLDMMIDNACRYDPNKEAIPHFLRFVYEYIWLPLVAREETK